MKPTISLFLRQSYQDAWEDYQRSLLYLPSASGTAHPPLWDYIVLTASNEAQAEAYRAQIEMRLRKKLLPRQTKFVVLPDPDGKRVGSGGATLNVLRYIAESEYAAAPDQAAASPFSNKRILVIHSGGDSKRVPQYSACGKLFSPVPRELPNGKRSTLFDEFIIGMSGVPSRIKEGMLTLSGDVLLLFNPLQIEMPASGAAAISFKEAVETGKNHGVFHRDEQGNVGEFLHKQSVETLTAKGAVNKQGKVDIDTGAVLFSVDLMNSLYALISDENGRVNKAKFAQFVNEKARLSFYGDFLYPLAGKSTLDAFYKEKPEGSFCPELEACRRSVWNAIHAYRMKLLRLSPAAFIHFGTTRELLALVTEDVADYQFLDWTKCVSFTETVDRFAVNNAIISKQSEICDDCYIEDSYVLGHSRVNTHCVLSHVTVDDQTVPAGVVLHGLKLESRGNEERFSVRIYGVEDNPKGILEENAPFLNTTMADFLTGNHLTAADLWEKGEEHALWTARLYPVCPEIRKATAAALNVYEMAQGRGDVAAFRAAERTSLKSSFNTADTKAILALETHLRKTVKVEKLFQLILDGRTCEEAREIFKNATISNYQFAQIHERAEKADYSERMRIYYYLGKILGGVEGEGYTQKAFETIQQMVMSGVSGIAREKTLPQSPAAAKKEVVVRLPLRVNWGGGWSDTPPYCNEHGGTVLNAAILLNGDLPVEVQVRPLEKRVVVLESADIGVHGEFSNIEDLQDCHNPYDPFALHKAALIACGLIASTGGSLNTVLEKLGCGLYMSTQVHKVPKGSGLGTSSVLAGACVKALFTFLNRAYTEEDLYDHAMCMEQIMSTGGGWQDQVGGLTGGIKYITSAPGARQQLKVRHLQISPATMAELNERFAIIYTGQRRLARNLLRDVVGRYISANHESLAALEEIQRVAAMMTFELERGNVDGFAELLNQHWELSKQIDAGSTNTCIDQIFLAVEDLLAGHMMCGAGGGGFLQVVLKKGVSKNQLRARLHEVFQDCGVDVWESKLV